MLTKRINFHSAFSEIDSPIKGIFFQLDIIFSRKESPLDTKALLRPSVSILLFESETIMRNASTRVEEKKNSLRSILPVFLHIQENFQVQS